MIPSYTLTEQQQTFFNTFGYLHFPGLVKDRVEEITEAFESVWATHGGGHHGQKHDGTARSCIVPFIDQDAYLCTLLDDPRVVHIASTLLGDDFNYMGSDGNYYAGDTPWHSDGWQKALRHIKLAFYLDPLTADTGSLRVIPGSHKLTDQFANTLEKNLKESTTVWGVGGQNIPATALETQPGDVCCFIHNLKHAAFGGSPRRRMFTINLSVRYPQNEIDVLKKYLEAFSRFWVDRPYGETMINTAGPDRMRHLEQVMANDSHVAALAQYARETMPEPSRG